MVDVRGDVLRPPHGTTPAAVKSNVKSEIKLRCHGNEYDDLLTLFHFSSSEAFFLQYAKFQ